MKILVTGCAGFIGFHLCLRLLKIKTFRIHGIDNLNNYYDVKLKKDRVKLLKKKFKTRIVISKIDLLEKKKNRSNLQKK